MDRDYILVRQRQIEKQYSTVCVHVYGSCMTHITTIALQRLPIFHTGFILRIGRTAVDQ